MIELKFEYPYKDENGISHYNLIKYYAENEIGEKYFILQNETNIEYVEAIDIYPSKYTYTATNNKIDDLGEENGLE